jgi:membrane protease subunit HflC
MRAERERIANQYRSEGDAEAIKIRAEADAERERITAEARRAYEAIRGEADAEATRIYGEAYSADPEFYRFLRTLESYETGIDADTILILPAEADYFRLLLDPELPAPASAPQPDTPTEPLTHGEPAGEANTQ